ncbi:MAG TPA: hypothetical protein VFV52_04020 [Bacilli bacterium]|nr:hypothetical protein [Bacilli bacterium]
MKALGMTGVLVSVLYSVAVIGWYRRIPKRMLPVEIAACWLVTLIFLHDLLIIPNVNLKWITTDKVVLHELVTAFERLVSNCLLSLLYLEGQMRVNGRLLQLLLLLIYMGGMTFLDYLDDWFGFVKHVHWSVWWSLLAYLGLGSLLVGVRLAVRRLLLREAREL